MTSGDSHSMPVATIQAVTAVPTLAPSSTICAMRGLTSSRSTKEETISAVAVELCSAMVATKPERKERRPPRVPEASPVRSRAPKARDTPSLTCARPNSSNATAPNRLIMTIVDSMPSCLLLSLGAVGDAFFRISFGVKSLKSWILA
jgi:hypothetical protein